MYEVLVWGIGKEFSMLKNILHSKGILLDKQELKREKFEIVGYVDRECSRRNLMISLLLQNRLRGLSWILF